MQELKSHLRRKIESLSIFDRVDDFFFNMDRAKIEWNPYDRLKVLEPA
ncbi:hypothetical protein LEP1GSC088_1735 [Leptospira interrogans str. L1207]|nr:hypothetical protein LEP1GSC088_1735 [Leptospira interrogans str. L1207]